jgi:hypothetical protein
MLNLPPRIEHRERIEGNERVLKGGERFEERRTNVLPLEHIDTARLSK